MVRRPLTSPRALAWILASAAAFAALVAVQHYITSPGHTTEAEFRILLLAAAPCLITALCARWVDNAPDRRRDP